MLINMKQIPNPMLHINPELYFPFKEFLRQKPILADLENLNITKTYCTTNARQLIMQSTIKYCTGVYLILTIYYMIPLSNFLIKNR